MFSLRGLRLYFPSTGALGYVVCFTPRHLPGLSMPKCGAGGSATHCSACPVLHQAESSPLGLSVRECGAAGSASGQTACPVYPTLRHSQSSRPQLPVSAPPTGLDECLFFISLVSDFLAIRFSVSSGCARRRSVSTYATILVLQD